MKFKNYYSYLVAPDVYLSEILTEIPNNAFIDKGRCGIGGTTLEIKNENRCSLITGPTRAVLKAKEIEHEKLFIVDGNVSDKAIEQQLALRVSSQKIMSTPEGIKRIMKAAKKQAMLDEMLHNWFFLLDECHSFICECFRLNILQPFEWFWRFDNKAVISATPYYFSDMRFNQFDHHKIRFTSPVGTVKLIDSVSSIATLLDFIRKCHEQEAPVFIFINSVRLIVDIIKRAGLTDCSIFVADDEDGVNMVKLGELSKFYQYHPCAESYSKFNFFSSKYFEGWDLVQENATIIVMSDVHIPHSRVSVSLKLVQAAGRLRVGKGVERPTIYHITNHFHNKTFRKSLEEFTDEYYQEAELAIKQYDERIAYRIAHGLDHKKDTSLDKIADIEKETRRAIINTNKVDQLINQAYTEEVYNDIEQIEIAWENASYDVELYYSTHKLETTTTMKRKSKAQQLKEDYHTITDYRNPKDNKVGYFIGRAPDEHIRIVNPLAYAAAKYLTEADMVMLKYNVIKVREKVIVASNKDIQGKLSNLVALAFTQGESYPIKDIKPKLQSFYDSLDYRDPKTGEIIIAKCTDLKDWFDVDDDIKLKDTNGKFTLHGYRILRKRFVIRAAA